MGANVRTSVFAAAIAVSGLVMPGYAETLQFMQPIGSATLSPEQSAAVQALKSLPTTQDLQIVKLDQQALTLNQDINIGVEPTSQFAIKNFAKRVVGDKPLSWTGAATNAAVGSTEITVHDDNITGVAQTPEGPYRIWPIGGGLSALVKVDVSKMPPEHPPGFREKVAIHLDPYSARSVGIVRSPAAPPTTITVLVAYTPAVANVRISVPGLASLSLAETNQSYKNSGVNINLVAAPAAPIEFKYTETGSMEDDLAAFAADPDIAKARAASHANLAVLFVADRAYCGWAQQILASAKSAFAIVYFDCATGPQYSFGHEIGHLLGACHNPQGGPNPDDGPAKCPYSYGHGFLDAMNKRRTMMSLDCASLDCMREQQWARPTEWGDATVSNDARVLNETAAYIAGLHLP